LGEVADYVICTCNDISKLPPEFSRAERFGHFMCSVHFDFGSEPGYLLWLNPTGLQVARVKPE